VLTADVLCQISLGQNKHRLILTHPEFWGTDTNLKSGSIGYCQKSEFNFI